MTCEKAWKNSIWLQMPGTTRIVAIIREQKGKRVTGSYWYKYSVNSIYNNVGLIGFIFFRFVEMLYIFLLFRWFHVISSISRCNRMQWLGVRCYPKITMKLNERKTIILFGKVFMIIAIS